MIRSQADKDYQVVKLAVIGEVKERFHPEFLNGVDEIVVFHSLAKLTSPRSGVG